MLGEMLGDELEVVAKYINNEYTHIWVGFFFHLQYQSVNFRPAAGLMKM